MALSTHTVAVDQWHNKEDELTITKNDFLIGADTMKTPPSHHHLIVPRQQTNGPRAKQAMFTDPVPNLQKTYLSDDRSIYVF